MPTAPDLDYWTILPVAAHDRPAGRINPLAFFNPGECGAWVATLQALRALPSAAARPRSPEPAHDDAQADVPPLAIDAAGA